MSDGTMKSAGQLMDSVKPTESENQNSVSISREVWAKVWLGLIAQKHQSKSEGVTSSTCEYWRRSCEEAGLTEAQVINGCKRAKEYTDFLGMGKFIELCKEFKQAPCHKPYQRIESKPASKEFAKEQIALAKKLFE